MTKDLILTFMLCFIEVLITPNILAADTVKLSNIHDAAVETVPIVEESDNESTETENEFASTNSVVDITTPTYSEPENSIEIAGRTIEIFDVGSTAIDAGNHVNRYGNSFLYGHNSASVFGPLSSLSLGETFTVTIDDDATDYEISKIVTYKKIDSDSEECEDAGICKSGSEYLYSNDTIYKMSSIVNGLGKYDLAIMTCAGESLGDGDATHRLVIYTNQI